MCRLYGSLSSEGLDLVPHLISSRTSLLAQSNANPKRLQKDGWGVGHYARPDRPAIVLSTRPVFRERRAFSSAVAGASGPIVIAHVRAASNPLNLPWKRILRPENQQPFKYRNWLFAHNGTLMLPDIVRPRLGRHERLLKGANDSEVFFWLLMASIERTGSVRKGFRATVRDMLETWEEAPAERREAAKVPYIGLNCIFSDGERFFAACKYDGHRPKKWRNWLCRTRPARPLFEMCYRLEKGGRGLVVASERTLPTSDWTPLKDGSLLEARLVRGRVKLKVGRI